MNQKPRKKAYKGNGHDRHHQGCVESHDRSLKSACGLIDQDADDFFNARRARRRVDHSTAGAQWIWRMLSHGGSPESSCVAEILSLCIASHHSGHAPPRP